MAAKLKSLVFEVITDYNVSEREIGLVAIDFASSVVSLWRHRKWES